MVINSKLRAALDHIAPVRSGEFSLDKGETKETYIVINYDSFPDDFGDDEAEHEVFSIQVHLFCPAGLNSLSMRHKIKNAIYRAGFSWPRCVDASDRDGQHYVFECQLALAIGEE